MLDIVRIKKRIINDLQSNSKLRNDLGFSENWQDEFLFDDDYIQKIKYITLEYEDILKELAKM